VNPRPIWDAKVERNHKMLKTFPGALLDNLKVEDFRTESTITVVRVSSQAIEYSFFREPGYLIPKKSFRKNGPGGIRTPDIRVRSPALCPS
jgi:hypothetical protein